MLVVIFVIRVNSNLLLFITPTTIKKISNTFRYFIVKISNRNISNKHIIWGRGSDIFQIPPSKVFKMCWYGELKGIQKDKGMARQNFVSVYKHSFINTSYTICDYGKEK